MKWRETGASTRQLAAWTGRSQSTVARTLRPHRPAPEYPMTTKHIAEVAQVSARTVRRVKAKRRRAAEQDAK